MTGPLSRGLSLIDRAHSAAGLPTMDFQEFWARNDRALRDPFSTEATRMPLGISMSDECVWDELSEPAQWGRFYRDDDFHAGLCRRYNERAVQTVGRALINEHLSDEDLPGAPRIGTLADIFEARSLWQESSWSYWLQRSANDPAELARLLDRVQRRLENLREAILPPDWAERRARMQALSRPFPLYRDQRGPVTFAMSVYGEENLIYLILDDPDLAARFRDLILTAILERARILDEEAGFTAATSPRSWSWADDNCALLTPDMYRFFASPILDGVFARYAPDPADTRYQHSDSAMGHLLPILGAHGLTEVNFGPTLSVAEIREHLPRAVIHGQLAPFAFSRNEERTIVEQTVRDFELSRERRGLLFTTAGSVNPGSRLTSLRLVMAVIEECCRY